VRRVLSFATPALQDFICSFLPRQAKSSGRKLVIFKISSAQFLIEDRTVNMHGRSQGFLRAEDVYAKWMQTLSATQQPNFVPFNGYSGFETIGATEYVNYMLLQSDPGNGDGTGRFLGLFEAWPQNMDASFTRLRGRGAFVVSSSFDKATKTVGVTTIVSGRGEDCVMRLPQSWSKSKLKVLVAAGAVARVEWSGADRFFSFKTEKGESYTLSGC
jgi:hypothetical protein